MDHEPGFCFNLDYSKRDKLQKKFTAETHPSGTGKKRGVLDECKVKDNW